VAFARVVYTHASSRSLRDELMRLPGVAMALMWRYGHRSVFHPNNPGKLTGAYWDTIAAVDPLLPSEGAFAVLGLGGGTVAQNIHKYWPLREMEGWELDSEVVDAARPHLGLAELEAKGSCLRRNPLVCRCTLHPVRRAQHGRACAVGAIGEK
jgi:hypothetical protein